MADPYIGKLLDNRYEVLERIGTGGMAVVCKAKDNRLNRLVAVKILRDDLAQDEDFRRRFNAESQAVAQLSSPNIVSIYDVSRGGDTEYIVMELIDGITLKQYMERRGQLNWREALHFIIQIMRGLSHAHSRGIIHRDIKPQNIMVLRDGSLKVADFGIACLENASQTLTRQALGSVHYISPEQARGERTDARSDIYSAGVVLYEMLTGRLPFEGDSAVSVALKHLSSIPPDPRSLNPDIPEQMELICLKAMAPELDRRYPSADTMMQDLEQFREAPDLPLEFSMEDLRPDAVDEPTRPLRMEEGGSRRLLLEKRPRQRRSLSPEQVRLFAFGGAGVAALAVLVLLIRAIFYGIFFNAPPEQYVVKNVIGYTVAQARELDGVRGIFEIREEGEEASEELPRGAIVRQDPEADKYRKGSNLVIRVWVSSGEDVGSMPNVVNQTVAQAELSSLRELTRRYDLTVLASEEDAQYNNDFSEGCIISTVPQAGEELRKGDTIRLFVSKGPYTWPLASFVGMNLDLVKSQMDSLHLLWDISKFVYSDADFGTILSQDPDAFTPVRDGTKVSFIISRGPENDRAASTSTWRTSFDAAQSTDSGTGRGGSDGIAQSGSDGTGRSGSDGIVQSGSDGAGGRGTAVNSGGTAAGTAYSADTGDSANTAGGPVSVPKADSTDSSGADKTTSAGNPERTGEADSGRSTATAGGSASTSGTASTGGTSSPETGHEQDSAAGTHSGGGETTSGGGAGTSSADTGSAGTSAHTDTGTQPGTSSEGAGSPSGTGEPSGEPHSAGGQEAAPSGSGHSDAASTGGQTAASESADAGTEPEDGPKIEKIEEFIPPVMDANASGGERDAAVSKTVHRFIPLPQDRKSGEIEVVVGRVRHPIDLVDCTVGVYPLDVTIHETTRLVVYLDGEEIYSEVLSLDE